MISSLSDMLPDTLFLLSLYKWLFPNCIIIRTKYNIYVLYSDSLLATFIENRFFSIIRVAIFVKLPVLTSISIIISQVVFLHTFPFRRRGGGYRQIFANLLSIDLRLCMHIANLVIIKD